MNTLRYLFLYIRHLSFIAFLIAIIVLYSGFFKFDFGMICLIISMIYILFTFIMIFVKNVNEEYSLFNNFVLSFLHLYICFIAYKYYFVADDAIVGNLIYFKVNFFIISLCMLILTINKILLTNSY